MAKKGYSTQGLVNTYPLWSRARTDEQSAAFQMLNSVGAHLDELREQITRADDNLYLTTSVVSDPDVYYRFRLPRSYSFSVDEDPTEFLFAAPTVSGLVDTTYYGVTLAPDNNIDGFWYEAVPTRVSLGTTYAGSVNDHLVASGLVMTSPLRPLIPSGVILVPNHLHVTVSGATSCIDYVDGLASLGTVQIHGTTRAGLDVVEDLIFLHDDTLTTIHDYSEVSGVYIYGIKNADEARVSVASVRVGSRAMGEEMRQPTAFDLAYTLDGTDMPLFWTIDAGPSGVQGQHCLELHKYDTDDAELRLDGWAQRSEMMRFELLDTNGRQINPTDLAVQRRTRNIWVTDSGTLYLYDAEVPYPDMSSLLGKDYDAPATIQPESYYVVSGENLDLDFVWNRPTVGMVRHRTWVEHPNGDLFSLEAGSEVTYHTGDSSWVFGEPVRRMIKPTESSTIHQRGNYIYSMETVYTDGSTYTDRRVVSVLFKQPLAEFPLADVIGVDNDIIGVDVDSEGKLWVVSSDGDRYQIDLHYDIMLVDIDKKILYFREEYDEVRVW